MEPSGRQERTSGEENWPQTRPQFQEHEADLGVGRVIVVSPPGLWSLRFQGVQELASSQASHPRSFSWDTLAMLSSPHLHS